MLVLSRRSHESIRIGDNIVVTVLEVRGDHVRLGIDAPHDVEVHRQEVYEAIQSANVSAASPAPAAVAAAANTLRQLRGNACSGDGDAPPPPTPGPIPTTQAENLRPGDSSCGRRGNRAMRTVGDRSEHEGLSSLLRASRALAFAAPIGRGDCTVTQQPSPGPKQEPEGVEGNPFPPGFFDQADPSLDAAFYSSPRLVTHIDEEAIAAVGCLYDELGVSGDVLDLMSSWVSHFRHPPARLTSLGMNSEELDANPLAGATSSTISTPTPGCRSPTTPSTPWCAAFPSTTSPDLSRCSLMWLAWCAQEGRSSARSPNRCFPTKAIRGWLYADDEQRCEIVKQYFRLAGHWDSLAASGARPASHGGDPMLAVWAHRARDEPGSPLEIAADR